jgi:hypothetical protein
MTTTGIITMIVILAFVWGGFGLFIAKAVSKERAKSGDVA